MESIKVEIDCLNEEDYEDFCFICLQKVISANQKQTNLANLFFQHLKIKNKIKALACENCGKILTKLVKLFNILEKVRLEMDYLLDSLRSEIVNSNKSIPANSDLASAREIVLEKCGAKMKKRKAQIILERLDPYMLKNERSQSDCGDDWLPNCDNESDSNDNTNDQLHYSPPTYSMEGVNLRPRIILDRLDVSKLIKSQTTTSTADEVGVTPVINEIIDIKYGVNLKESANTRKAKCSKRIISKSHLKRNYRNDAERKKRLKCPSCPKTFNHQSILRNHNKAVHLRIRPYKCDICDIAFALATNLKMHKENVHLRLRPFKCPTCDKAFFYKKQLKEHQAAVHLRLKPHKCDVCGRAFAQSVVLNRHKLLPHKLKSEISDNENFPCKMCEKTFTSIKSLKRHELVVHPEKMFPCNICKKKFKTKSNMQMHVTSVHEKKRHYCQVTGCDKNYSVTANLFHHYRWEHPDFAIPGKPTLDYSDKMEKGESMGECTRCKLKFQSLDDIDTHLKMVHGTN